MVLRSPIGHGPGGSSDVWTVQHGLLCDMFFAGNRSNGPGNLSTAMFITSDGHIMQHSDVDNNARFDSSGKGATAAVYMKNVRPASCTVM
jgi:hypothetical protein